jgi:16S rRNA (guanine527-N7)-methyltransferase
LASILSLEFLDPGSYGMFNPMPPSSSIDLEDRLIGECLSPFGIALNQDQFAKVRAFTNLLLKWNRTISLTSILEPVDIVTRHFGESMYAANLLSVENCRLADVGTGAGFPGLALKIVSPSIHLTLIEANRKKCAFLSEALRVLDFGDVEIRAERFEEIRPERLGFNIITSRAVGELKQLLHWSANALARRGHLMLWIGAVDSTRISRFPGWTWQPPAHIPESQRRFILIGRPIERPPQIE